MLLGLTEHFSYILQFISQILQSNTSLLFNKLCVAMETHSLARKIDRISQLPEDVLALVLSRLSIIDAVQTSSLSRKWKNVHTFIPRVNFDYFEMLMFWSGGNPCAVTLYNEEFVEDIFFKHYPVSKLVTFILKPPTLYHQEFVEAVDTFFQHYSSSKLVSFRLSWFFNSSHICGFKRWMQSLCRLGVAQLDLVFCKASFPGPDFSWHLLSEASSLENVRLCGFSLQSELLINQCYPIKALHFHRVRFAPGTLECILSSCPSLRSLTIVKCIFLFSKLRIHSPSLTLLRMKLWVPSQVGEIELDAINLNSFEYVDCVMRKLLFTSVPLLERLSITLYGNIIEPNVFGLLPADLTQVKSLYYQISDLQEYKKCELNNKVLSNLREVFFILVKPECDLPKITSIFDTCPLLQKFHLVVRLCNGLHLVLLTETSNVGRSYVGFHNSNGFHFELEEVELSGFSGTENEMGLALYILKCAATLKRMRIIRCPKLYVGYGRWDWMKNVETRFSKEKRRMIHERLQGQALSESAQVTIYG
ncbi:hypothetical protein ACJIZ3_000847 [Penstemon smallii]|uniref:F-box domain-containing protein n=1 Tax=Penstemon smallii TaxID=265156 RepID=A0ABD3U1W5_9LAMI